MNKLFDKYSANRFQDFKGSTVSAKLVLNEGCLNDLLAQFLRGSSEPAVRLVKTATAQTNGPIILKIEIEA